MNLVQTTVGLIAEDKLVVKDIITNDTNCRVIATEWFLGEELVRRDVNVNILNGLDLNSIQEKM